MGIYNCAGTLPQAVAAIQNQTYSNWELILCDDGSTDNTYGVAQHLAETDSRIILLRNAHNLGLNQTLNNCLAAATGSYIARMDGDDDCLPDRFEKQVALLETHPEFQITSSQRSRSFRRTQMSWKGQRSVTHRLCFARSVWTQWEDTP